MVSRALCIWCITLLTLAFFGCDQAQKFFNRPAPKKKTAAKKNPKKDDEKKTAKATQPKQEEQLPEPVGRDEDKAVDALIGEIGV